MGKRETSRRKPRSRGEKAWLIGALIAGGFAVLAALVGAVLTTGLQPGGWLREPDNDADGVQAGTPIPTQTGQEQPEGTLDNPVPMHTTAFLSEGWQVTVTNVIPNATDLVLGRSSLNEPPKEGYQFFIATIEATNRSGESSYLDSGVRFRALGPSGESYKTFEDSCGVIPDRIPDDDKVPADGTISGNICWQVRTEDADSLKMYDEPMMGEGKRTYMSLV